jgi:hypothetical protein
VVQKWSAFIYGRVLQGVNLLNLSELQETQLRLQETQVKQQETQVKQQETQVKQQETQVELMNPC